MLSDECACDAGQALMAAEDKAHKALQDGIDADAQPAQLLEELLTRHSGGEDLKAACTAVLKGFPDAEAMLNSKQTYTGPAAVAAASSFSTPAPKAQASGPEQGSACDETVVEEHGKAAGTSRADAEETVMFGAKLSAAKSAPSAPRASSASTPSAATPKPTATPTAQKSSSAAQREDTVTFGSKITTPGAEARAAAAAEAAGEKNEGKTALKKGAVRSVKRTGDEHVHECVCARLVHITSHANQTLCVFCCVMPYRRFVRVALHRDVRCVFTACL